MKVLNFLQSSLKYLNISLTGKVLPPVKQIISESPRQTIPIREAPIYTDIERLSAFQPSKVNPYQLQLSLPLTPGGYRQALYYASCFGSVVTTNFLPRYYAEVVTNERWEELEELRSINADTFFKTFGSFLNKSKNLRELVQALTAEFDKRFVFELFRSIQRNNYNCKLQKSPWLLKELLENFPAEIDSIKFISILYPTKRISEHCHIAIFAKDLLTYIDDERRAGEQDGLRNVKLKPTMISHSMTYEDFSETISSTMVLDWGNFEMQITRPPTLGKPEGYTKTLPTGQIVVSKTDGSKVVLSSTDPDYYKNICNHPYLKKILWASLGI